MNPASPGPTRAPNAFLTGLKGLAADFWADGPAPAFWVRWSSGSSARLSRRARAEAEAEAKEAQKAALRQKKSEEDRLWRGTKADLLEAMWGQGYHLPCGDSFLDMMVLPLGLNKEMSVLDIGAGFGAVGRHLAENMKIYVTGLEEDTNLVRRGKERLIERDLTSQVSLMPFEARDYKADKKYHCIISREFFYRLPKKDPFFLQLGKSFFPGSKPRGQIAFTDFILEEADKDQPAVLAWLQTEPEAKPLTLEMMKNYLVKMGLDVRVTEDLSDVYRKDVMQGFVKLALFLKAHQPAPEVKPVIRDLMQVWAARAGAMKQGLKIYRFYAIKA